MMRRLWLALALLGAATAHGQANCPHKETLWSCVGLVEIGATRDGKLERVRLTRFEGGESLAEVEKQGVIARALTVRPSGLTLYQGLPDPKAANSPQSPFMFFSEAIGWGAYLPLHAAYPLGPDTVPEGTVEKTVQVGGKSFTLTTTRKSRQLIEFRYGNRAAPAVSVEGSWDGRQPEPWSDDFPVSDWKHDTNRTVAVLRDARSSGRDCPKVDTEAQKTQEKACGASGGEWSKFGVRAHLCGIYTCAPKTADGGKPCQNRNDCEYLCVTPKAAAVGTAVSGECARVRSPFGCNRQVDGGKVVGYVCMD